jgi:uncharacterized membrane protein
MKRVGRPVISLGLVMACVAGTMILGTALKSPCSTGYWGDQRQYKYLCYSDIVPLLATEQLQRPQGSRLPYLDPCRIVPGQNCDEYPVLTMYFIRVAAWISGAHIEAFYFVNAALLLVCAMFIGVCLYLMAGARALYFAIAPTLLIYGTMNWDLLAVAFATAGLLFLLRGRDASSGLMLGLGAAAKFYPGMLAVPFIAQRLKERRPDGAITLGWATIAGWAVVNVPFVVMAFSSWSRFFSYNSSRLADFDSLWFVTCRHASWACVSTRTVNLASATVFVAGVAAVWLIERWRFPEFPRWTLGFPIVVIFLLTNKVYSPQYGLWLLPWFALALPGLRRFVAFEIADVAVFVTRFWFFGRYTGGWGTSEGLFEAMVLLRALVLLWCVVAWVRTDHEPLQIETRVAPAVERATPGPEAQPA